MEKIIRKTRIVFLLLVIATGCGAHRLKQAQDSYNQAARIEAEISFEQEEPTGDPLQANAQALQNYRVALALANESLERYPRSLKRDQLYGTALMLKALCQWRIAALDWETGHDVRSIVHDIENHVENKQIVLGTRDRVMLRALPGLHEHALGLQQTDYIKARALFESALETLDNALKIKNPPPLDHPVRIYVCLAQMRILRTWRWAEYPNAPGGPEQQQWVEEWNKKYLPYRRKLSPLMETNPGLKLLVDKMDIEFGYDPG